MQVGNVINTAEEAMMRESNHMTEIAHDIANENGDLTENMVDMMETQRSFEANAVVITTADEMLDEILSM